MAHAPRRRSDSDNELDRLITDVGTPKAQRTVTGGGEGRSSTGKGSASLTVAPGAQPAANPPGTITFTATQKIFITLLLVAFSSSQNLLIAATESDEKQIKYLFVSVTLLSELVKFGVCLIGIWSLRKSQAAAGTNPGPGWAWWKLWTREGLLYAVPGLLYFGDNNVVFMILMFIDPATMALVWNLKIVSTALLFRFVLKRPMSELKWIAVMLLFVGVITTQSDHLKGAEGHHSGGHEGGGDGTEEDDGYSSFMVGVSLTIVGTFLTALAGVYTEWVLKRRPSQSFWIQNIQLYSFGILFNLVALLTKNWDDIMERGLFQGYTPTVWLIVFINAASGVCTGAVFKYLDVMISVFAHVVALLVVIFMSTLFFGLQLSLEFFCGLVTVLLSMYLYHHKPPAPAPPQPIRVVQE